jgi:hypothetical protein
MGPIMADDERTPHEPHVAAGYCPVISRSKAWCDRQPGHSGMHGSPRVPHPSVPVSPTNPNRVAWDG